jgi:hypothetical protein
MLIPKATTTYGLWVVSRDDGWWPWVFSALACLLTANGNGIARRR